MMRFDEIGLDLNIMKALSEIDYEFTTPIQEKSISHLLGGKDLLGLAQTGTGKTAAFVLPILQKILDSKKESLVGSPRAIILVPTRELCAQVGESVETYSKYIDVSSLTLFGGQGESVEATNRLENEAFDILVATPRKLFDLVDNKVVSLKGIEFFVLDEVDRMLDVGSIFDLKNIIKRLPRKRQSMFFSATLPTEVSEVAHDLLSDDFINVKIEEEVVNTDLIKQNVMFVQKEHKYKLLLDILKKKEVKSAIIFTNSKGSCDELVRYLRNNNVLSEALHSQKSQTHRTKVINNIKSRKIKFLIATDLASRGLDIENITHVINYELPTNPEVYVHRIGRCGRAGTAGEAYTLCSSSEKSFLDKVEKFTGNKINVLSHQFHSEFAKKAKGKDAKPKFKAVKGKKKASKTVFAVSTKVTKKNKGK